jgi:hypothetical protein
MRLNIAVVSVCLIALCGCRAESDEAALEPADTLTATAPDTASSAPPPPIASPVIRSDGIGVARLGMRIRDLRSALPAGTTLGDLSPFMVDVNALPVVQGADTLYYVLIPSGEPSTEDSPIDVLATTHPAFRTNQGVGPGSTLAEAASIYGMPTLSYHTEDESREYARFPALPSTILIRVGPSSAGSFAGVYMTEEAEESYHETTRYDDSARVLMVMVRRY